MALEWICFKLLYSFFNNWNLYVVGCNQRFPGSNEWMCMLFSIGRDLRLGNWPKYEENSVDFPVRIYISWSGLGHDSLSPFLGAFIAPVMGVYVIVPFVGVLDCPCRYFYFDGLAYGKDV